MANKVNFTDEEERIQADTKSTTLDKPSSLGLSNRYQQSVYKWPLTLQCADAPNLIAVTRDDDKKLLHVTWENGIKAKFAYVWLRDNCPAAHTYNLTDMFKARKMLMSDLDVDVEPTSIENCGDHLRIEWPRGKVALYKSKWLALRNLNDPRVRARRKEVKLDEGKQLWGRKEIEDRMRWFDFDRLLQDDRSLHEALIEVVRSGILLIDGAPKREGQLKRLAERISFEYLTHFGHFFNVKSEPNPTNLACTTNGLGVHSDLPFLQYAPQLQALHYIKQSRTKGGENQFVDAFYVAKKLKVLEPEAYKILCTVPVEYVDDGRDFIEFDLNFRRPIFCLDNRGELAEVHFNNQMRTWFYDLPVDELRSVYKAMKTLYSYMNAPSNMLEIKMQPGQIVLFHNLRVLHGRSAYEETPESGSRHMEGCYFNWDFVKSKIRVLRDRLNIEPNQVSV